MGLKTYSSQKPIDEQSSVDEATNETVVNETKNTDCKDCEDCDCETTKTE
jgi:hypothetical protein